MKNYVSADAEISACERYRYRLSRVWDPAFPTLLIIGLNPSTADGTQDDPTIRRCVTFAQDYGYGSLLMGNLFAFRCTNPKFLLSSGDRIGPLNDRTLAELSIQAAATVIAWGNGALLDGRWEEVLRVIKQPLCFGLTSRSQPRHPLYLPKNSPLKAFERRSS